MTKAGSSYKRMTGKMQEMQNAERDRKEGAEPVIMICLKRVNLGVKGGRFMRYRPTLCCRCCG